MKLISGKKIFANKNGCTKHSKKSFKITWIHNLLRKSSSTIRPQSLQARQQQQHPESESVPPQPLPQSPLQLTEFEPKNSFKFKSLFRHLNITKFKIICAKYFKNEDQVVQYCTKYLNDFPSSYDIMCDRAEAYGKLKQYDEAINDLDHAISTKPSRPTAWCLRGVIKGLEKSYIDALGDLNNALAIEPSNCLALKWRAFCYYMLKSYDQALWDLNMVIILGCTDSFTYINRADTNRELKNFEDASQDLAIAFKFDDVNEALAHGTRGVLNFECGKYRAAVMDLTKALELQPNNAMFLRNRSGAYRMLMYPEEALEDLEKSCMLEPENDYQYGLRGAIYLDMRRWYDSLKNLNKAIRIHPNKASPIGNRAELFCKLRKYDLAIEDVNQAIKLEPKNVIAHQQLADLYRRKHRYREALGEIEFTLSLDPNNINTLLLRADIYFLMEKYNDSFMDLDNAIRIAPRNSYALTSRGELYFKLKRYDDALKDINAALNIKATNVYALEICGDIYRKQQRYQEALDNFNKSLELYPLNITNKNHHQRDGEDLPDADDEIIFKLIQRNTHGYDEGFAVTQQMQGERNFSNIFFKRGITYYKLGMFKAALKDYNQSLKLLDGNTPVFKKRAHVLHHFGRLGDALMDINKYLKVHPRCSKSLELREGILNDVKKRNLESGNLSKLPRPVVKSSFITDATSKAALLPLSKVPNFGDTEVDSVYNLLSEIQNRVDLIKKCREQTKWKELQNHNNPSIHNNNNNVVINNHNFDVNFNYKNQKPLHRYSIC